MLGFQEYEYFCTLSRHKRNTWNYFWNYNDLHSGVPIYIYIFILFYLPHNNYIKYRKRKKEVARRPNRNYRSLWEVRPPRTAGFNWRKDGEKSKMERFMNCFHSYSIIIKLIFSFFLKEERDWELMTSLSSELKNLGPWKKGENFLVFVRQYGRR